MCWEGWRPDNWSPSSSYTFLWFSFYFNPWLVVLIFLIYYLMYLTFILLDIYYSWVERYYCNHLFLEIFKYEKPLLRLVLEVLIKVNPQQAQVCYFQFVLYITILPFSSIHSVVNHLRALLIPYWVCNLYMINSGIVCDC